MKTKRSSLVRRFRFFVCAWKIDGYRCNLFTAYGIGNHISSMCISFVCYFFVFPYFYLEMLVNFFLECKMHLTTFVINVVCRSTSKMNTSDPLFGVFNGQEHEKMRTKKGRVLEKIFLMSLGFCSCLTCVRRCNHSITLEWLAKKLVSFLCWIWEWDLIVSVYKSNQQVAGCDQALQIMNRWWNQK